MELVLFRTPTEWAALALVLIAGWLWGLASAPGTRKWRNRLAEAEGDAASYREAAETDLRAAHRQIAELKAAASVPPAAPASVVDDDRVKALEAENARLTRYLRTPRPDPAPVEAAPLVAAAAAGAATEAALSPAPAIVHEEPAAEEAAAAPVEAHAEQKSGWLHAMEAGVAGAMVGAVADRLMDRADGKQDHGLLHNLGAAAAGAAVGVLTERLAERHAEHEAEKRDEQPPTPDAH